MASTSLALPASPCLPFGLPCNTFTNKHHIEAAFDCSTFLTFPSTVTLSHNTLHDDHNMMRKHNVRLDALLHVFLPGYHSYSHQAFNKSDSNCDFKHIDAA